MGAREKYSSFWHLPPHHLWSQNIAEVNALRFPICFQDLMFHLSIGTSLQHQSLLLNIECCNIFHLLGCFGRQKCLSSTRMDKYSFFVNGLLKFEQQTIMCMNMLRASQSPCHFCSNSSATLRFSRQQGENSFLLVFDTYHPIPEDLHRQQWVVDPEDGGTTILRIVGNYLPAFTA